MQRWFTVMLVLVVAVMAALLSEVPQSPVPGTAERSEILDSARLPAEARLHQPVDFLVEHLRVLDGWAFLLADVETPAGVPIAATGDSRTAARASGGGAAPQPLLFAALLNRQEGQWHVVTSAAGPNGLAWRRWGGEYGAPPALFDLGSLDLGKSP